MTPKLTPGVRLRRRIDASLGTGLVWTEAELTAIDKAVAAEDRAHALQRLLDAELAKPAPSSRRATELAGEIRQLEGVVVRLVAALAPEGDAAPVKSRQHQAAADARWDKRSHRRVPVEGLA